MRSIVAAVLAGGEGRRFRPYTDLIPKPMVPVGPEERPLLEHIVAWLARYGLRDIVLLVGYRWRQVANYFRDGGAWGVRIRYSLDTDEYTGTGGALLNARRRGLLDADTVLVWYGDILAPVNVHDLLERHSEWRADATLVLADQYQVPVGVAEVDQEGNVTKLEEKPWLPLLVTIGVLALNPRVLDRAEQALGTGFDIMGDLVPWMISQGMRVKAYIYRGPWYDLGSLERYNKLDPSTIKEFLHTGS
ncbi:hypothetical protein PABY_19400 [Pyrodictium abyssi]|uniref:Nucleotidyl transferase domain-containing protein n=1 Tax=Pyrodictium abyssi TaxID=54256 RepID=A0ABM8IZH9_9CREN|nr:hypothetical protein PABY_19400 [Pyrodictium abyssi]